MSDDIITRDSQGNVAVNTVSGTEGNVPYNYDDCFTLDTNNRRALRVVVDRKALDGNYINVSKRMPEAGASVKNQVHIYTGATNANFTRGYIYECVGTITYSGTVSFEAASLSGTTVSCDGDDFANFLASFGDDPLNVVKGTITYSYAGDIWRIVGKDANDRTVVEFQVYTADYEQAGFTFTGTPEDGDVIAFTCSVAEESASYSWERLQP